MQHLKQHSQFQAALSAEVIARTPHFVLHRLVHPQLEARPQSAILRLGAMVPKRWAKRAVTRNAIKRQIYAVSSLYEKKLPTVDFLIRLKRSYEPSKYISATSNKLKHHVRQELVELFEKTITQSCA
ncbi:MAG: ribonuclease P protein component [Betaproteobacteria bacterium]